MWTSWGTISNSFMNGGPMLRPSSVALRGTASPSSSCLLTPSEAKSKKSYISTSPRLRNRMHGHTWLPIAGPLLTYIPMCIGASSRGQAGKFSRLDECEEAVASSSSCLQILSAQLSLAKHEALHPLRRPSPLSHLPFIQSSGTYPFGKRSV